MDEKDLLSATHFALEQIAQERSVIKRFAEDHTDESVASVTLVVGGIEHVILVHDEDFGKLAHFLLKLNKKESVRLHGQRLIQSATANRSLSYSLGRIVNIVGGLNYAAAMILSSFVLMRGYFESK